MSLKHAPRLVCAHVILNKAKAADRYAPAEYACVCALCSGCQNKSHFSLQRVPKV